MDPQNATTSGLRHWEKAHEVDTERIRELEKQNAILEARVDEAERRSRIAETELADLSPKYDDLVERFQNQGLFIKNLLEDLAGVKKGLRKQEMAARTDRLIVLTLFQTFQQQATFGQRKEMEIEV